MSDLSPIEFPTTNGQAARTGIAMALAKAQAEMGKALKSASNPHFKSKYADLESVMDACLPALNQNGIAVVQPTTDDESGRYVETVLIHGESGQELRCRVPLILMKNDMQGYGSAVTYARRYGLMCMAGIAPEDDDGNAAAAAAPRQEQRPQERTDAAEATAKDMIAHLKAKGWKSSTGPKFSAALADLKASAPQMAAWVETEIATLKAADTEDEIPY